MDIASRIVVTILLIALSVCWGCARLEPLPAGWRYVPEKRLDADARTQRNRALAARQDLYNALMNRLETVLGAQGPVAAVTVCSEEAPVIAGQIAQTHGLDIGRTSFRLRNPRNTPPVWARSLIDGRVSEPAYLVNVDGRFGMLMPIQLQAKCVTCHGPRESIPADVLAILDGRYPEDQATGFNPGDLRGWFWVEVPSLGTRG